MVDSPPLEVSGVEDVGAGAESVGVIDDDGWECTADSVREPTCRGTRSDDEAGAGGVGES